MSGSLGVLLGELKSSRDNEINFVSAVLDNLFSFLNIVLPLMLPGFD